MYLVLLFWSNSSWRSVLALCSITAICLRATNIGGLQWVKPLIDDVIGSVAYATVLTSTVI